MSSPTSHSAFTLPDDIRDDLLAKLDTMMIDDGYNLIESPMGQRIYALDEWPDEADTCRMATIPPARPSSSSMRVAADVISATRSADHVIARAERFRNT